MITIGHLAKTYHKLPSEVKSMATTYDMMIMDVFQSWENHNQNPQDMSNYREEDLVKLVQGMK